MKIYTNNYIKSFSSPISFYNWARNQKIDSIIIAFEKTDKYLDRIWVKLFCKEKLYIKNVSYINEEIEV